MIACYAHAQQTAKVVDTVFSGERAVLLLENKKWVYLEEYVNMQRYDSLFSQNWVTGSIHAYLQHKNKPLPDIRLNLLENSEKFVFPLDTFRLLRGYTGYHTGLDLKGMTGDSVRAAFGGKVRFSGNIRNGYGNLIIIRHYNGLETYYSHLSKISLDTDDYVKAGDLVGLVGSTGRVTGSHLHFETRYSDFVIDPQKIINGPERRLICDT
ncbi:MAG: M23 family metallopeptidase, partial [Bacteroidales bacterium]|nr:M23 family metallopeptidase [Bacteroidales bacterium]